MCEAIALPASEEAAYIWMDTRSLEGERIGNTLAGMKPNTSINRSNHID
jgi:hypothetical protein